MLARKIAADVAAVTDKQTSAAKKRAAKRMATAPVPVKTEEQREEMPIAVSAKVEVIDGPAITKATSVMRLNRTPDYVSALIALFPVGAPDYYHPDEDKQTLAMRQMFDAQTTNRGEYLKHAAKALDEKHPDRWLPATPRLSKAECYAAAKRNQAEKANAYGPTVTRLARVVTPGGQRAERTMVGRISDVQAIAPDEDERLLLAEVGIVRKRAWVPVRMDLYPTA